MILVALCLQLWKSQNRVNLLKLEFVALKVCRTFFIFQFLFAIYIQ